MKIVYVGLKMPDTLKNKAKRWAKKDKLPLSAWIRNLIEKEDKKLRESKDNQDTKD